MAIKRKNDTTQGPSIPAKLDDMLLGGFTASCLEKKYKEAGKEFRGDIKNYLEDNQDGFECDLSKSWKCDYGSVNIKVRANYSIDSDKLLERLSAGKVTVETLLSIAKFSATDLNKMGLGDCATEGTPTEFLELRASSEFKAGVDDKFQAFSGKSEKPAPKKPTPPKQGAPKKQSSLEKIRKAKGKAKGKKSSKADLDSILGE